MKFYLKKIKGDQMKAFITTFLFLGLQAAANASTLYSGIVDLRAASNNAKYPTIINAGIYSVEVDIEAAKIELLDNVVINKTITHERDGNQYTCTTHGAFEVGRVKIHVKDFTSNWKSTHTSKAVISFESSIPSEDCSIDTTLFEGTRQYTLSLANIRLELPIKDSGFDAVSLVINPIKEGFQVPLTITEGTKLNTLKVLNVGSELEKALEEAGEKNMSYDLSLTKSHSYYHFDTGYTAAKKVIK